MTARSLSSIVLNRSRKASLQSQLALELKRLIQRGGMGRGAALPSSRELAADLQLSRNTVLAAYDQLVSEGYLEARPRSGLFVADALAIAPRSRPNSRARETPAQPSPLPPLRDPPPFRPCQPDVRLFPLALWNRLRGRALRGHAHHILHYQSDHRLGLPALRRALADYLRDSRGVHCPWEQIAITSGSQQALFMLSLLLLGTRGRAYLEEPGYRGARLAFEHVGAEITAMPVDAEGVLPPERLARGALVYVTPARQFPTGASLPVARRLALLEAVRASESWVVEDDYDSEFRYGRAPLPSLHSLDTTGRVINLGTMSKVVFPSLRIGYLVLPPALIEPFIRLRALLDDHGPLIDQATLAEFIASGSFYSHIRRCRREYAARLDTFLSVAAKLQLPFSFANADGGMNLLGRWQEPPPPDAVLTPTLIAAGFDIPSLNAYARNPGQSGRVFGFTAFTHAELRAHLRRLSGLLR